MKRPGSFILPLVAVLCAPLVVGPAAYAGDKEKKTTVEPGKQLKKALKNLQATEGYQVTLSVEGGVSNNPDHEINQLSVRKSYFASVAGKKKKMMHVPDMKTYRTYKTGVRFSNGNWRNLVADPSGKIMDRLFAFPEIALSRAVRHAKKAKWQPNKKADAADLETDDDLSLEEELQGGDDTGKDDKAVPPKAEGDKKEKKKRSTTVPFKRQDADGTENETPRFMRVDVPTKVALTHFLEVEKSGCFGGG